MDQQSPTSIELMVGLGFISLLAGWLTVRDYLRGQGLAEHEPRRPVPWNGAHVALVLMFFVGLSMIVGVWFYQRAESAHLADLDTDPALLFRITAATSAIQLLSAGFALVMLKRLAGASWEDLGLDFDFFAADVGLGVRAFLVAAAPVYAVQILLTTWFPSEHPIQTLMEQATPASLWLATLSAVVVAPFAEEVVFRLLFQGWLEKAMGRFSKAARPGHSRTSSSPGLDPVAHLGSAKELEPFSTGIAPTDHRTDPIALPLTGQDNPYSSPRAPLQSALPAERTHRSMANILSIVLSSALFAVLHSWPDMVALFLFALMLGYLYQRTHRVFASIVMHACLNLTSVCMLWVNLER